ncbi:MAG: multiubiquitin domain-containing protein [Candidatus Dadabacteria bacterium]|nr:multiubiquitin domain-containing protein [Candidatus Dadabacteria bacterium]
MERFFVIQRQDSRVKIFINEKPIIVIGYEHTGLDIKQAAIDQGVNIQLDFILSVELGPGRTKIVADSEMVKVQRGQKFIAIANDDNS